MLDGSEYTRARRRQHRTACSTRQVCLHDVEGNRGGPRGFEGRNHDVRSTNKKPRRALGAWVHEPDTREQETGAHAATPFAPSKSGASKWDEHRDTDLSRESRALGSMLSWRLLPDKHHQPPRPRVQHPTDHPIEHRPGPADPSAFPSRHRHAGYIQLPPRDRTHPAKHDRKKENRGRVAANWNHVRGSRPSPTQERQRARVRLVGT